MTAICFYFQAHQPFRLRRYHFFDIGAQQEYFDEAENRRLLERVAERCYRPMNALLLRLIERHDGEFRCAFSLSGTLLDQLERWSPPTLESFAALSRTGCVEFLGETAQHSLAALCDEDEFLVQAREHRERIAALFGQTPRTFRNTELICDRTVARLAEELGYDGLLGEGADALLQGRSAHQVYRPEGCRRLKLLLRSYDLSDDIAFRFSNRAWSEWPLTAEKFAGWLSAVPPQARCLGLFLDYETFGEHQWAETGIFQFFEALPAAVLAAGRFRFRTPGEVLAAEPPVATLALPRPISWADTERDLSAWLGNGMQRAAHAAVYELRPALLALGPSGAELLDHWRRLTTSDHFYYMCVKHFSDGDVHRYFSPFATPHDAYITLMNVLADLRRRLALPGPALAPA